MDYFVELVFAEVVTFAGDQQHLPATYPLNSYTVRVYLTEKNFLFLKTVAFVSGFLCRFRVRLMGVERFMYLRWISVRMKFTENNHVIIAFIEKYLFNYFNTETTIHSHIQTDEQFRNTS